MGVRLSNFTVISCWIVFLGFVLGSLGEVNFSLVGLIFGVMASAFIGLYGIYVKKSLALVKQNQWQLLYHNTLISSFLLIPFCIKYERNFMDDIPYQLDASFWSIMTLTAVSGFLINVAIFLQIKYTSPLSNTISGITKACVQSFLAWLAFGNDISMLVNSFFLDLELCGYFHISHRISLVLHFSSIE